VPQRPGCADGPIPWASSLWPAGRQSLGRARPAPYARRRGRGRLLPGSNAVRPGRGRRCATQRERSGGAPRRTGRPWEAPGEGALPGPPPGVAARRGAPRPCPLRPGLCWDTRSGSETGRERGLRTPWTAPPLRLPRTGARHPFSHSFASDGMRAPTGFSGAAPSTSLRSHRPPDGRQTLKKCVVPSRGVHQPTARKTEHVARGGPRLASSRAEKHEHTPLLGGVGLLTTGGRIRVRLAHLCTAYGNDSMTTLPPSTTCMWRSWPYSKAIPTRRSVSAASTKMFRGLPSQMMVAA